jgi:putative DNA methylase
MSKKRLIETAFPLAEASAASLHEKNMRHGHISTLHLWPARRPLAASRAAIAAAMLPDPTDDAERSQLVRRLGGRLVARSRTRAEEGGKVDAEKVTGEGGILWWGQETGPDLSWFRDAIFKANGGRAPKVLDPFAGGGAIPMEAMRLGCEVTANDLNPVAWFILKCTLQYPQALAGQRRPLPDFVLRDVSFMETFLKGHGMKPGPRLNRAVAMAAGGGDQQDDLLVLDDHAWLKADIGWHVRAWGQWVLRETRRELANRYPTFAEWMALDPDVNIEAQPPRLLVPNQDGETDVDLMNRSIAVADLKDPRVPRWVLKPAVAYLWARTVRCKSCRATIPLLKTRWLCKKEGKRIRLVVEPRDDGKGVTFAVESGVPLQGATATARKAADKEIGAGTMSRAGVKCPSCSSIMSSEDLRYYAREKGLGSLMTAVVVDGPNGKEYRVPHEVELLAAEVDEADLQRAFESIPFGKPDEVIPLGGSRTGGGSPFTTPQYGLTRWCDLFTSRQLLNLATFTRVVRKVHSTAIQMGYPSIWAESLWAYLALANDRLADYGSALCSWHNKAEKLRNTFGRFALPIIWDFTETAPFSGLTGDYGGAVEWVGKVVSRSAESMVSCHTPQITRGSATQVVGQFDAIVTDPPYYDAIPYSDLMDFFYVWLRRCLFGMSPEVDAVFQEPLGPKWDHSKNDGELIDDSSRFGGNKAASKKNFEDGMSVVFKKCADALTPDGILVIVFANKNPDAWETLVGALIRAGFVVDGSLPIQTEMGSRTRAQSSAALSSSVWLVCRKRDVGARPGFSGRVLEQMRKNISIQMRRFWDAGVKGPNFVWAATGPALEAYSRHPVVFRESSASGEKERMPVAEFLQEVRRIVVEFAVGRVLKRPEGADEGACLDDVTTYYVLHRDSFGMEDAPVGACILYALSCGLSDADLIDRFEVLARTGGNALEDGDGDGDGDGRDEDDEDRPEVEASAGTGSTVRLRRWDQRKRRNLGLDGYAGRPAPMIDRLHRLMQLWRAGDVTKVNSFLDQAAVARDPLFAHLIQALIELARREGKGDEAVLLESISNHLQSRSGISAIAQASLVL